MATSDAAAKVGMSPSRLDRIEPGLQPFIDHGTIAGCVTLVARQGETVHRSALGHRDREAGVAMTDDTIFRIYSMTKPVVCTALMLLFEEGRFDLDAPVAAYIPAFAETQVFAEDGSLVPQAAPMTIRHVLTHTSGLTYDFMEDNPAAALYREARIMNDASRTLAECIDALAAIPLAFQPGAKWHYSVGSDVVGRLVEVISGQSLQRFLAERIFEPLGMEDTGFTVPDADLDRLSAMYGVPDLIGRDFSATALVTAMLTGVNERQDVSETYPTDSATWARGGLGLFSTADDYLRFAVMLLSGRNASGERIIGRKTLEMMHANHLPPALLPYELLGQPSPGNGFGLGSRVMMDPAAGGKLGSVGCFGWAGAAKTYSWVDPVEDMVGVFMSQYMTGPVNVDHIFRNLAYQAIDD